MKKKLYLILMLCCFSLTACSSVEKAENDRLYSCDIRYNPFQTKILTNLNGSQVTIKGDILKFVEDPLEMVDSDGNVLANADDDYNFINQDDHAIYVNGDLDCILGGDFGIMANHYTIYDSEYKEIAKADFNAMDTYGSITSTDGVVWVEYASGILYNDYNVYIHESCELSDESVLLMVASYKSDKIADSRN